jgi:hypothetical protein
MASGSIGSIVANIASSLSDLGRDLASSPPEQDIPNAYYTRASDLRAMVNEVRSQASLSRKIGKVDIPLLPSDTTVAALSGWVDLMNSLISSFSKAGWWGLLNDERLILDTDTSNGFDAAVQNASGAAGALGVAADKWPFTGGVNASKYIIPANWTLNLFGPHTFLNSSYNRVNSAIAGSHVVFGNPPAGTGNLLNPVAAADTQLGSLPITVANGTYGRLITFVNEGTYSITVKVHPTPAAVAAHAGMVLTAVIGQRTIVGLADFPVEFSATVHVPMGGSIRAGARTSIIAAVDEYMVSISVRPINVVYPMANGYNVRTAANNAVYFDNQPNVDSNTAMQTGMSMLDLGDISLGTNCIRAFARRQTPKYAGLALSAYVNNPAVLPLPAANYNRQSTVSMLRTDMPILLGEQAINIFR